jgi:hypothetical protein
MNSLAVCLWELGSSIGVITTVAPLLGQCGGFRDSAKSFRMLELQIDQGYGMTGILAGVDKRYKVIVSMPVPRICELVQFG